MTVVILLENVKLGKIGDEVDVLRGYADNYLLPRKKAVRATAANRAMYNERRKELQARDEVNMTAATAVAEQIQSLGKLVINRQADDNGRLYGALTPRDVVKALQNKHNITIQSDAVDVANKIKELGEYTVALHLHSTVLVQLEITVVRGGAHTTE